MRAALVLFLAAGGMVRAQPPAPLPTMFDLSRVPDRPQLVYRAAGAALPPDTNDASTYYAAGVASLSADPAGASAAFYWASRLNPSWAEPYFARWYVLQKEARARRWQKTLREALGPALPDTVQRQIDSLVVLAAFHNPFFDERIQSTDFASRMRNGVALRREHVKEENIVREEEGRLPLLMPRLTTVPHSWYLAYAERHFDSASADLASLIAKYPDALPLYLYRSKAQYALGQYDSAAATLRSAIGRVDRRDSAKVWPVYFAPDMFYYAIGMAQAEPKHDSAAQAAFQSAVTLNLGFYMAHLHLASLALGHRDSATALTEARIAAEIRPEDPVVQLFLGYTLLSAHRPAEALEHFRAATVADPYYALPYYYIGQANELAHDTSASLAAYRDFLGHASRSDNLRQSAEEALAVLGGPAK
jgi:tetratricopeptide (TPR) repeat protein